MSDGHGRHQSVHEPVRTPAILDFDPTTTAVINPSELIDPLPDVSGCVITFFHREVDRLVEERGFPVLATIKSEMGEHPVYAVDGSVALLKAGVGAALAAGMLEELIALGFHSFIACGSAGVLDKEIQYGHLVVPTSAVRQEGVSYHYLPPEQIAEPHPDALAVLCRALDARTIPYLTGTTWTTDGFYRETHQLVQRRRAQGCLTVEMEAAALFAVSAFRKVRLAAVLYGGDDVSQERWDRRQWQVNGATASMGSYGQVDTRTALLDVSIDTVQQWVAEEKGHA